jgi:hypothetical protein
VVTSAQRTKSFSAAPVGAIVRAPAMLIALIVLVLLTLVVVWDDVHTS